MPIGIEQAACAISPERTIMPSQQSTIQNLQSKNGVIPIGIEQDACAISPERTVMPSQQSTIQNLQSKNG
ncbi:hypothetical protein, partial [Roseiflexus sp.]|uniref:hypothetical protein n=1 Tax=Roseiflexus sp. TaxID=2562120 RepID=UPI00398A71C7